MKKPFQMILSLFLATAALSGVSLAQQTETSNQMGILTCEVEGGFGMIIASKKEMVCTFAHANGGSKSYVGSIGRLGIDIGKTTQSTVKWAVFALAREMEKGALEGAYSGVSGEVSLIAGLGANVLVGGLNNSFALQPLSVQVQAGLNIAAGVARMKLRSVQ